MSEVPSLDTKDLRVLVAITILLLLASAGSQLERFKKWAPWLSDLQIRSYNWVSALEARKPRSQWVVGVEIDDKTFYDYMKLQAGDATNRAELAKLVKLAVDSDAAVIGLDIFLNRKTLDKYDPFASQNNALLDAIRYAAQKQVPVILTCSFDKAMNSPPNIYEESSLPSFGDDKVPYRTRVGFGHGYEDLRMVPLIVEGITPERQTRLYSSFALEIVDAYEGLLGISPRSLDRLKTQIAQGRFVYTTFLVAEKFPHVSAADLLEGNNDALKQLNKRIVLIGGNRHTRKGGGDDEWLDDHLLPPLHMRGMYFHANYVEGLLDDRIKSTIPESFAFLLDLLLGGLMIYFSTGVENLGRRLARLAIFFIPVGLGYIASINLGYVVDFVLPLLLLFLHAVGDNYLNLWLLARSGKEA